MLPLSQPQPPLDGDFMRRPDARPQPIKFYRPPEHIECSAFPSARNKLAVHKVGANERGYQRMHLPNHRQRILPRSVKERCICNQSGSARGKKQKIGHFQRVQTFLNHSRQAVGSRPWAVRAFQKVLAPDAR
jgi:hypothetical protein